jgi:DNA-binding GntR family transcriptional regulator
MNKIERPKSLTELVTDSVRQQIVTGTLELGSSLSEVRIAKEMGVSRTPIREAFNRLEMEGLVHTVAQRGTFVFSLEPEELGKICDVRVKLETTALRASFRHDPVALGEALAACTRQMVAARKRGDDAGYLEADTHFHQVLFDLSDNRFLNDAYQTIASKMAALRNRLGMHPDHMQKSYLEHLNMVELIGEGRIDAAEEVLIAHIGRKEGSYWQEATV